MKSNNTTKLKLQKQKDLSNLAGLIIANKEVDAVKIKKNC